MDEYSDRPTQQPLDFGKKRINSSLIIKNDLIISLFNINSSFIKFKIREIPNGGCIFYSQINVEKYDAQNFMASIAHICQNHVQNLNDSAFGYFFHVLVLVINHLHLAIKNRRESFLDEVLIYNSKAPNFQVHVHQDLFHHDFYNFSLSYDPDYFEQFVSDAYYEIFKNCVQKENEFLKYLPYLVFHLVR